MEQDMTPRRVLKIDPQTWPILSQLLDEWLDLHPEARSSWLENLGPEYADVLPALRELLATQAMGNANTFLNALPALRDAGASATSGLAAGKQIGPYRLARELGHGGMGVVWLAERADGVLKRPVALKLPAIPLDQGGLSERFARERDILAQLAHPNIARLYDAGVADGGQPYLALEYVDGEAITAHCDRQVLGVKARLMLFLDVLRAVQSAHMNLVVHRDLKPSNIMVTGEGQVRLLDFGIAKLLTAGEARETELTRLEGRALTPDYASPEQITGDAVTTASDVYSLGVVLYELLTGERPYRLKRDTRGSLEEAILSADAARPSQVCRDEDKAGVRGLTPKRLARTLRGDLDTIVLKALQKQPSQRYSTADAFAEDIQGYLRGEAVLAQPESVWYCGRKFVLRNKLAVASAAGIVMALAVGLSVALWEMRVARLEQKRADTQAATAKAVTDFLQNDLLAQASPNKAGPTDKPDPNLRMRTVLDRAAARIGGRFAREPLVEGSIRQTIGDAYRDLGSYVEARQQLERALALRRDALGEQHRVTLDTMRNLGEIYWELGEYARAEPLYTKALDLQRRVLGDEHRETLETMNGLALLYDDQGKYAKAEPLYIRTLELNRRVTGEEHHDTLEVMNNLAVLYREEEKYAQAESLYARVLDVRLRVLGEQNPETLTSMNNLAALYTAEYKFAQAEPLFGRVVELRRQVLGAEHPLTLTSMNALAAMYRDQERYLEAEALFRTILDTRRRVLGDQHLATLITMNFLAGTYFLEGKYAEAEPLFRGILEVRRRLLGEEHPDTLNTSYKLGLLYQRQGKYPQAEPLLTRTLEVRRRVLGESHSDTLGAMSGLAALYRSQGKYGQAQALLAGALEIRRRVQGPQHPETADVMVSLGELLLSQRNYAEAEPLLREALANQEKAAPGSWRRYRTESLLGASLSGQRRYAEAEALLLSGYQGISQRRSSIPFDYRSSIRQSRQWLARLYREWERPSSPNNEPAVSRARP
jgi:serine/threonine protein kinase/tetratricopeptide (TPR) repeat protein